jgi:hypothetical protein
MNEVTRILSSIEQGDARAYELLPLIYDELRKLAAHKLAQEKPGQTLQATALVHEAFQQADEWIIEADKPPSATEDEGPRWSDLTEKPTILLLRREAEGVISYDSIFPVDPFAR